MITGHIPKVADLKEENLTEEPKDIYVVVAENNKPQKLPNREELYFDDGGPLIFEQYTRSADLESIKKRAEYLSQRYGKCRIAKLQFLEEITIGN